MRWRAFRISSRFCKWHQDHVSTGYASHSGCRRRGSDFLSPLRLRLHLWILRDRWHAEKALALKRLSRTPAMVGYVARPPNIIARFFEIACWLSTENYDVMSLRCSFHGAPKRNIAWYMIKIPYMKQQIRDELRIWQGRNSSARRGLCKSSVCSEYLSSLPRYGRRISFNLVIFGSQEKQSVRWELPMRAWCFHI